MWGRLHHSEGESRIVNLWGLGESQSEGWRGPSSDLRGGCEEIYSSQVIYTIGFLVRYRDMALHVLAPRYLVETRFGVAGGQLRSLRK